MASILWCSVILCLLPLVVSPGGADVIRLPLQRGVGVQVGGGGGGGQRHRRSSGAVTQHMEGISGEGYFLNISVGTPPQQMQILVDTGSSNTALAASPDPHISHYFNSSLSSTYVDSGETIHVPYTQGEWDGHLGQDVVTLTSLPGVSLHPNIAFIYQSTGFFIPRSNWQGILGLAYQAIARPNTLMPFWDTVRNEGNLSDVFSMQLCGTAHSHNASAEPAMEGNLVLGGISDDLYRGDILYTPIVTEMYYEVVMTDIAVGGVSLYLDCKEYNYDKTIVDSGTTHLRLPKRVFTEVVQRIQAMLKALPLVRMPSSLFWAGDELLCWEDLTVALAVFPTLSLSLLSTRGHQQYFTLHLTSQHYLRSVENVNTGFLGPVRTCLKFGISPSESGSVLGALLMESYYVVFDREHRRLGFADTTCPPPSPLSNISQPSMQGLHTSKGNLTACRYQRAIEDDSTLLVVSYIMAAVCLVCALPLIIGLVHMQLRKCRSQRHMQQESDAETVLTDGS